MDEWLCKDCSVHTGDINEYYMVHDAVWAGAGMGEDDMLCLGCLEKRLGRLLTVTDFPDYPINYGYFPRSDRFLNRLGLKIDQKNCSDAGTKKGCSNYITMA